MEELLIQILGNSPTLIAVLIVYFQTDKRIEFVNSKFDKRVSLLEQRLANENGRKKRI